jgi:hypothetical protein
MLIYLYRLWAWFDRTFPPLTTDRDMDDLWW